MKEMDSKGSNKCGAILIGTGLGLVTLGVLLGYILSWFALSCARDSAVMGGKHDTFFNEWVGC